MLENYKHPLIELLQSTGFDLASNEANFKVFKDLKLALSRDGFSNKAPSDQILYRAERLHITRNLRNLESGALRAVIDSYVKVNTDDLVSDLNMYSSNELSVSIEGELYCGGVVFDNINDWVDGFNGDKDGLNDIYGQWEHTIDYIDDKRLIRKVLAR